jgi:hypothetical protein
LKESEAKSDELEELDDKKTNLQEIDEETDGSEESGDVERSLNETEYEASTNDLKKIEDGEKNVDSEWQNPIFKSAGNEGEKVNNTPNSDAKDKIEEEHASKGHKLRPIETASNVNIPKQHTDMKSSRFEMFDHKAETIHTACNYVCSIEWLCSGRMNVAVLFVCLMILVRYLVRPVKKRLLQFSILCFIIMYGSFTLLNIHCT